MKEKKRKWTFEHIKIYPKAFYTLEKQSALVCYKIESLFKENGSLNTDPEKISETA